MVEDWKKIDAIGPECEVSRDGRVRQKRKIVRGRELFDVERKPYIGYGGRKYFTFREEGRQTIKYLHTLIAEAFIPNPDGCKFVISEDYANPTADNCHWVTGEELPRSEKRRVVKLSEEKLCEIRELLLEREVKQVEIAERFGISPSMVSKIKSCLYR